MKTPILWNSLGLTIVAFGCLLLALVFPFVSVSFEPDIPKMFSLPGSKLGSVFGSIPVLGDGLNSFFGGPPELFSKECAGDKWDSCFKEWLANKAGIPMGEQYLLGIISGLFMSQHLGDIGLGALVLGFSVLFPLGKLFFSFWISSGMSRIDQNERIYGWLTLYGKWSMTDVFVISLLITFCKAQNFNMNFQPELGVYCFAAFAILSSLAAYMIGKELGARTVLEGPYS